MPFRRQNDQKRWKSDCLVADLELASQTTVVLQDELGQGDDAMDIESLNSPSPVDVEVPGSSSLRGQTPNECQTTSGTRVIWNGVQLDLDDVSDEDETSAVRHSCDMPNLKTEDSDHQSRHHCHRRQPVDERRHYARSPLRVSPILGTVSPRHVDTGPSQLKEYFLAHRQRCSRPSSGHSRHTPRITDVTHRGTLDSAAYYPVSDIRYDSESSSEEAYVPGATDVSDFILNATHSSTTRGTRRSVCVQENDSVLSRSPKLRPSKHASRERRLDLTEPHHPQQHQGFSRHSRSRRRYSSSDSSRSSEPLTSRGHCINGDPDEVVHCCHHRNQRGSRDSFRGSFRHMHRHHPNFHHLPGRCYDPDGTKRHNTGPHPRSRTSPDFSLFHNSERLEKTAVCGGDYGRSTFGPHHESRQLQVYSDVGSSTPSAGEVSRSSCSLSNSDDASISERTPKFTDPVLRKREIEARLREIDSTERQLRVEDHSGQTDRGFYHSSENRRDILRHSAPRTRRSPSDSPDFEARLHRIRTNHRTVRY